MSVVTKCNWLIQLGSFPNCPANEQPLHSGSTHVRHTGDTLVERNVIVDCARGIGFGLTESGTARAYPDNPAPGFFVGHYDGVIRNNFVAASVPAFDTGIELDQARGTKVHHNTVFHPVSAFSSIDLRFSNTQVELGNNLVVKITQRNSAQVTSTGNVPNATAAWFVDPSVGDLHLQAAATLAIDKATPMVDPGLDIDGTSRTSGTADVGADER